MLVQLSDLVSPLVIILVLVSYKDLLLEVQRLFVTKKSMSDVLFEMLSFILFKVFYFMQN